MLKKSSINRKKIILFTLIIGVVSSILLILVASAATIQETDLNSDGTVDFVDLSTLLTNYGTGVSSGDVNKDNQVDIFDLSALLSNYGKSVAANSCATQTQHIPDGPDGSGGCWPGPSNTGPNAPESSMSQYSGSCNITAANTVIDSKVINCSPAFVGTTASGLVIKNS